MMGAGLGFHWTARSTSGLAFLFFVSERNHRLRPWLLVPAVTKRKQTKKKCVHAIDPRWFQGFPTPPWPTGGRKKKRRIKVEYFHASIRFSKEIHDIKPWNVYGLAFFLPCFASCVLSPAAVSIGMWSPVDAKVIPKPGNAKFEQSSFFLFLSHKTTFFLSQRKPVKTQWDKLMHISS